jgi:hypothetical protein
MKWALPRKKEAALALYKKNYEIIIQTLLKNKCKVVLQTPSIYDQTAVFPGQIFPGRNDALKICAGYIKAFGEKYQLKVVDYWTTMSEISKKVQEKDPTATIISKDRVHPGGTGHFIMAYQFLTATSVQPMVLSLLLQADQAIAKQRMTNGKLTDFKVAPSAITFTALADALPFPALTEANDALKLVDFTANLNQELLQFKKLKPANYQLKIDGQLIGQYSNEILDKGINLAQNKLTPQSKQAEKVLSLFRSYWQLEAKYRWMRGFEFGRLKSRKIYTLAAAEAYFNAQIALQKDPSSAAYKDLVNTKETYLEAKAQEGQLLSKMESIWKEIYLVNQPVPHRYELVKN